MKSVVFIGIPEHVKNQNFSRLMKKQQNGYVPD